MLKKLTSFKEVKQKEVNFITLEKDLVSLPESLSITIENNQRQKCPVGSFEAGYEFPKRKCFIGKIKKKIHLKLSKGPLSEGLFLCLKTQKLI